MAILSDEEFIQHQALLGSGFSSLRTVQSVVESGLALVVASTDVLVELDMLAEYAFNATRVEADVTASLLRQATVALETHITERSGQTFNDFLFTNGLKVNQDFADLSNAVGVPIVPENIE